jgi:hypothetical protein
MENLGPLLYVKKVVLGDKILGEKLVDPASLWTNFVGF